MEPRCHPDVAFVYSFSLSILSSHVSNAFIIVCLIVWFYGFPTGYAHFLLSVFGVPSFPLMPLHKSLFHPFYLEVLCFQSPLCCTMFKKKQTKKNMQL